MTDASGSAAFNYNRRGLLTMDERTLGASTWVTQYDYDKSGNLTQILYPTNDPLQRQGQVDYTYDSADRVSGVAAMINGVPASVASSLSHEPFGPVTGFTMGNGLVDSRTFGTRYQIGSWSVGGLIDYSYVFNNDLNLTSATDNLSGSNNRTFGYDEAHRLTSAAGPWGPGTACPGSLTYTYDATGNRQCKGEQSTATSYTYIVNTNLLDESTGGEVASYIYDSNGNTTGDGGHTYTFNDADRLEDVDGGTTATYTYDGDGRRAVKIASGITTYFFYDPSGTLLSEVAADPEAGRDYIYLYGNPVARVDWTTEQELGGGVLRVDKNAPNVRLDWSLFPAGSDDYVVRRKQVVDPGDKTFNGSAVIASVSDPTQTHDDPVLNDGNDYNYRVFLSAVEDVLYFYHSDDLGKPIAMTDSGVAVVWRAEHLPFGGLHAVPVSTVANPLRFPGQYADSESGLLQNVLRDYVPHTGRYAEPDPLRNPFAIKEALYPYVAGNPLSFIDPLGLTCGPCCDTPAKIASDKMRIIRKVNLRLFRYLVTHMHVPQTRCEDFAEVVEEGIADAMPQCHDSVEVFSKEQSLLAFFRLVRPPAPAHTATAVRPCDKQRWEDGFILDAWPTGILSEFSWDNWRPRAGAYTPEIYDPAGAKRGFCRP